MIYLGGKQGIKLHRGSRTKGRSKNTSLLIMGCPALRIWEYSRSTKGGGIVYTTHYNMTQIRRKILEDLFCGKWDKQFIRVRDRRIFLDVNPDFFQVLVDYLNG